jgi:hypothetical protein
VCVSWRRLPLRPTPPAVTSAQTNAWAKGKVTRPLCYLGSMALQERLALACQCACMLLAALGPLLPAVCAA